MRFSSKDLFRLILPLTIDQLFAATIGIADTLMVANVGEAAVSGISLVDAINMLLINIFAALATGGAIIVAQYLGREDKRSANKAAVQLLLVTIMLSVALMLLVLGANGPILNLIYGATEESVMKNAQTYFYLSALSYPFIAAYNALSSMFRSMNNPRVPMFASGLMNVVHIALNFLFIYGLNMGVAGAGLSTLITRVSGVVPLLLLLVRPHYDVNLSRLFPLKFDVGMIKRILQIGVPNGLENGIFQIGKILVQGIVSSFGTAAIAANAVAFSASSFAMLAGSAVSMASITVVGRCVGARDEKQASHYILRMALISQVLVGTINLIVLLLSGRIISLYALSADAAGISRQMLICASIFGALFWSFSFVIPSGMRAANDIKFSMVTAIFSMWTFRVGLGYVFSYWLGFGALGVWFSMGADWAFRMIVFFVRYRRGGWKNHQLI